MNIILNKVAVEAFHFDLEAYEARKVIFFQN